jgi:hypothetical protein
MLIPSTTNQPSFHRTAEALYTTTTQESYSSGTSASPLFFDVRDSSSTSLYFYHEAPCLKATSCETFKHSIKKLYKRVNASISMQVHQTGLSGCRWSSSLSLLRLLLLPPRLHFSDIDPCFVFCCACDWTPACSRGEFLGSRFCWPKSSGPCVRRNEPGIPATMKHRINRSYSCTSDGLNPRFVASRYPALIIGPLAQAFFLC